MLANVNSKRCSLKDSFVATKRRKEFYGCDRFVGLERDCEVIVRASGSD